MTLSLDHEQRLNLWVLLGLLEGNIGETRAVWKLQDELNLSSEEKEAIGHISQFLNGGEVQGWDKSKSLPLKTYELSDGDVARIQRAIQQFSYHRAASARPWLEPLLSQLPESKEHEQPNGTGPPGPGRV